MTVVNVTVRLVIDKPEDLSVDDVMNEINYDFYTDTPGCKVHSTEIVDHDSHEE